MSLSAQQKWDKKYLQKTAAATSSPPNYVRKNITALKHGRVLDVACGDGAVALFLAEHGFNVLGVDISLQGLKRLAEQSSVAGLNIKTKQFDLESSNIDLSALGQFDSIVISRYKPSIDFWAIVDQLLVTEGTLLLTTFNMKHHDRTGFSARFC